MTNCPVCSSEARTYEYSDERMMVEYGTECKVCGYSFSWAYGYTEIHVPGYNGFTYGYDWDGEEANAEAEAAQRATKHARLNWVVRSHRERRAEIAKLRRALSIALGFNAQERA